MTFEVCEHDKETFDLKTKIKGFSKQCDFFEFAIEGKFIIDLDGRCLYTNNALLRILNYPDNLKLINRVIHPLIHHTYQDGNKHDKSNCSICSVLESGNEIHIDNEIIWKSDGSYFPAECWSIPIKHNGVIHGALVSIFDITKRRQIEKTLEDSNVALRVILNDIEVEKRENLLHVQSHINRVILPIVDKIKKKSNKEQSNYLKLLEENIYDLTSPFISKLENKFSQLSPREVEICKFVKDGMTSKEIALHFNSSQETVRNQRKSIRKKFNIDNKKINLSSFLKTI